MSKLIYNKLTEAQQLLSEAREEELEGVALAAKIGELQRESERLLKSARQKQVIGTSQFEASKAIAKEQAIALGEILDEPSGAPVKKKGGRPRRNATTPVAATTVTTAVAAAEPVKAKRGRPAKEAKEAKPAKDSKPATKEGKERKPRAPKVPREGDDRLPPLHERIKVVLGSKEMTIPEVIEGLKAHKGWLPKSRDLGAYISLVLSTHMADHFDRVKRGLYKAKKGPAANGPTPPTSPTPPKPANPPNGPGVAKTRGKRAERAEKETNGATNGASNHGIEELGNNVAESPFSGADEVAA